MLGCLSIRGEGPWRGGAWPRDQEEEGGGREDTTESTGLSVNVVGKVG